MSFKTDKIIALICAMGTNRVIGNEGIMPWHLPGDMRHFRQTTNHKPIIMGRKTWRAIGSKPLPNRMNIIITRDQAYRAEGGVICLSLEQALALADEQICNEIMIIGGAQIYEQTIGYANKLYLTLIDMEPEGDVLFPKINDDEWQQTACQNIREDDPKYPDYQLVTYSRNSLT